MRPHAAVERRPRPFGLTTRREHTSACSVTVASDCGPPVEGSVAIPGLPVRKSLHTCITSSGTSQPKRLRIGSTASAPAAVAKHRRASCLAPLELASPPASFAPGCIAAFCAAHNHKRVWDPSLVKRCEDMCVHIAPSAQIHAFIHAGDSISPASIRIKRVDRSKLLTNNVCQTMITPRSSFTMEDVGEILSISRSRCYTASKTLPSGCCLDFMSRFSEAPRRHTPMSGAVSLPVPSRGRQNLPATALPPPAG